VKISQTDGNHLQFVCDVLDISSLESVRQKILKVVHKIDALINIAGGATPGASTKTEFLRDNIHFRIHFLVLTQKLFEPPQM
jgi:short-subunit dehydrogenase